MFVVSFMFVIRGKLELNFFLVLFANLWWWMMAGFTMVWQHSSLLTTCFSCSSLFSVLFMVMFLLHCCSWSCFTLLLLLVLFSFIFIVVRDHVFVHFYYCSIWSCFYLSLLLFLIMLLLISAIVHGHAIIHLYSCSCSCFHSSLLLLVVVLSLVYGTINGYVFNGLYYYSCGRIMDSDRKIIFPIKVPLRCGVLCFYFWFTLNINITCW